MIAALTVLIWMVVGLVGLGVLVPIAAFIFLWLQGRRENREADEAIAAAKRGEDVSAFLAKHQRRIDQARIDREAKRTPA